MRTKSIVAAFVVGIPVLWATLRATHAALSEKITLMGSLAEWNYPDAKFEGASMRDGGNREIQSVNCQAILTTDDAIDKVAKYYSDKFVSQPDDPQTDLKGTPPQSVGSQADSQGRPLDLRIITINRADTSTTLVISRGTNEKKTHIAWSQFRRL